MAWELLAIWVIVVATVIWFVRDEKRVKAEAELERAARYYAHAEKYRYVAAESTGERLQRHVPTPQLRTGGLSADQRAFIMALTAPKEKTPG